MSADRSEILFEVQEAIRRLQGDGRPIDEAALAAEFDVSPAEVQQCRAALALLEPALPPPRLPDDYELLGELGRGGMGVVYRARQRSLDREVAVKVLRAGDVGGGNFIERFRKEARSLARLRHPHIVAIHEVGETDGCLFYSMDLIAGASLAELIARGEVTPARAVRVLRQVASAIAYSHSHGVIHRDLKPANILIDAAGDAFVADFGLARDLGARADLTASGQILGTPAYMSPEQARGDAARIGERSDVYALGAILYECLTGRSPFAGLGLAEMVYAVVHDEPKRPRRVNPLAPRELEVVCGKAMAKRPEDRYATANALLEDLERFHEGRPLLARPPTVRYRVGRLLARQRRALLVGGTLAAIVLGVFFGIVLPRLRPPAAATVAAAQELLDAGEPAAALVLAEKAATQPGKERADAAIRSTTVAALLALVRALPAQPDVAAAEVGLANLQRARDLAVQAQDEADRDAVLAAAWPFAGKAAQAGAFPVVDAVGSVVERILAVRRVAAQPSFFALLTLAIDPTPTPGRDVLEFLEPALREADHPLRAVAARIVANLLVANPGGELAAVFAARAAEEPRLGIPLLELLDRLDAPAAAATAELFVKPSEPGVLAMWSPGAQELLVPLARDGAGLSQALAAELLGVAGDLPLRMHRDAAKALIPDAARARAIATLAAECAALSPREGYRRRVAAAVEALAAAPKDLETFLLPWLAAHTQAAPTHARQPERRVAAWQEWWREHATDDPRVWFAARLGIEPLPEAEEAPALLARYLRARHPDRAAWHFLLSLVALPGAGRALPCWPWPDTEPEYLPMAWYAAVPTADEEPPHVAHVACLRWRDGDAEPSVAFEEHRELRVGDAIEVSRGGTLPALPLSCESPRVPGVHPSNGYSRGAWTLKVARLRLQWTVLGSLRLVVDDGDASWGAVHSHVGSDSVSHAISEVDADGVAVLLRHTLPAWQDGGRGGEQLVVATLAPGGGAARAWSLADWRRALASAFAQLSADFWSTPNKSVHWGRLHRAQLAVELAKWLPIPEAARDLARLTVRIPQHDPPGADDFSRTVTRARLLLGDATVLDAPDFAARVPVVAEDDSDAAPDTRFWARVWLASTDARLRSVAAARVRPALLPPAMAAAFAAVAPDATATLPVALAAAVAAAPRAQWRARFAPDPGILAAAVVAALLLLVAAGATLRMRDAPIGPATLLIAGGLLALMFDLRVFGVDVLSDALGAGIAALGAWLLARRARGRGRWLAGAFFLAAAGLGLLAETGVAPTAPAATVGVALAVLSLPCLAYAFPLRRRGDRWLSVALTLAVVGAFGVRAVLVLYNDIGARLVFGIPGRLVLGGPSWTGLQEEWLPLSGMVAALVLVRWRARTP